VDTFPTLAPSTDPDSGSLPDRNTMAYPRNAFAHCRYDQGDPRTVDIPRCSRWYTSHTVSLVARGAYVMPRKVLPTLPTMASTYIFFPLIAITTNHLSGRQVADSRTQRLLRLKAWCPDPVTQGIRSLQNTQPISRGIPSTPLPLAMAGGLPRAQSANLMCKRNL